MELSREELKQIFKEIVIEVFEERTITNKNTEKEWLSLSEAVKFLADNGYHTTEKYMYQLRYKGAIPYARINGKLSFSRNELLQWIPKQRTYDSRESEHKIMHELSKCAQRKEKRQFKTA